MDTRESTLTVKDRITARLALLALKFLSRIMNDHKCRQLTSHMERRLSCHELDCMAFRVANTFSYLYAEKSDNQSVDAETRDYAGRVTDMFDDISVYLA